MNDEANSSHGLLLDQKTIDVLVANIIPTSKYFETRFDHLQYHLHSRFIVTRQAELRP